MPVEQQHGDTGATVSLVRRLQQLGRLSDDERRLIESASLVIRNFQADQDIAPEGKPLLACPVLLDGFACRYRMLESGQRQITAFLVPDDICDLTNLLLRKLAQSIGALTATRVAFIPHAVVHGWAKHHPGLGQLLWRATLLDAAISREWIVNVGRRTAYQRTAHLLCELMQRMRPAGRARGLCCAMPLTQIELGDALGLTPVHVNRTLQLLRGERLIELGGGVLTVRNWRELKQAAGFDPAYLRQTAFVGRSSLLKAPLVPRGSANEFRLRVLTDFGPLSVPQPTVTLALQGGSEWIGTPEWNCLSSSVRSTSSASARSLVLRPSSACIGGWCARRLRVRCRRPAAIQRARNQS